MRLLFFVFILAFSSNLLAAECSEIHVNNSADEIVEIRGLNLCEKRASLFMYGLSKTKGKDIYQQFYNCNGESLEFYAERYRTEEVVEWLVSDVQVKGSQNLAPLSFKKNKTSLNNFITDVEQSSGLNCVEVTRLISNHDDRFFNCGSAKLRIQISPYTRCTDSWRSL